MKIRQGFVSNSSSSSFVVALNEVPKSKEDVVRILFNNNPETLIGYDAETATTAERAAETIFNDIKSQTPYVNAPTKKSQKKRYKEILESVSHGWFPGHLNFDKFRTYSYEQEAKMDRQDAFAQSRIDWEKYEQANTAKAEELLKGFLDKTKGAVIYTFSYADEDGRYFSNLEHGGTFDNVQHLRISYH